MKRGFPFLQLVLLLLLFLSFLDHLSFLFLLSLLFGFVFKRDHTSVDLLKESHSLSVAFRVPDEPFALTFDTLILHRGLVLLTNVVQTHKTDLAAALTALLEVLVFWL